MLLHPTDRAPAPGRANYMFGPQDDDGAGLQADCGLGAVLLEAMARAADGRDRSRSAVSSPGFMYGRDDDPAAPGDLPVGELLLMARQRPG